MPKYGFICCLTLRAPKDYSAVFTELDHEKDRAAAIVGTSFLEHELEGALKETFRRFDDKDDLERIFGVRGILSGFYAKFQMAYALKIIGPATTADSGHMETYPECLK